STTVMVSASVVPGFPSRMSLRNRSLRDGNGPSVSDGVTAQAAGVVAPVVVVVVVGDGLVGVLPHPTAMAAPAAPIIVMTSRRVTTRLLSTSASLASPRL